MYEVEEANVWCACFSDFPFTLSLLPLFLFLSTPCPVLSPAADCDSGGSVAHPTLPGSTEYLVSL